MKKRNEMFSGMQQHTNKTKVYKKNSVKQSSRG